MKILFGIQGTGNGHISRARILAKYLSRHQLDVTYLLSGREKSHLFDMDMFGDYLHRKGLTFHSCHGRINYWKTLANNSLINFYREVKSLNVADYDLIISDYEPITAWAGKIAKKPTLGIGHQYAFGKKTPLAGDTFISRAIMRNFAPTSTSIGLHWYPYDDNVLPPIIDVELTKETTTNTPYTLVYLPFEDLNVVCDILNQCTEQHFIVYAPNGVKSERGNVSVRATSYQAFTFDLVRAKGVICNTGFELISECLHLGLPILTKPLNGQMEQHSNAQALRELNLATTVAQLNVDVIQQWLSADKPTLPRPFPDVARAIAQNIANGQWQNINKDKALLWQLCAAT